MKGTKYLQIFLNKQLNQKYFLFLGAVLYSLWIIYNQTGGYLSVRHAL